MSKYPRTFHFDFSPGTTSDDRIAPSVESILGIDIVITEKLDGSNTAMTKGGVYGRSHGEYTKNPWDLKSREIWERIKRDIDEDVFIFGEGMYGIHSIEYSDLDSYFYIFGVRDNNIWLPWEGVEEYSYLLDIPTVPVLFEGVVDTEKELKNLVEKLSKESSALGGTREGIVARNANHFHNDDFDTNVFKWVRKGHVQTGEHWTRTWKKATIKR